MNRFSTSLLVLLCTSVTPTLHASDEVHVRGWFGGEFALAKKPGIVQSRDTVKAFPNGLSQKAGIFVRFVPTNSPSSQAGLRAGDLILQVNDQTADSLSRFHDLLESIEPGQAVHLTCWRQGETNRLTVTAGRETYRREGAFGLGFVWSGRLDLWPNPDFSLFVLGYERAHERAELHSPESDYIRAVRMGKGAKPDPGHPSHEGWRFWATPFSLSTQRRILTQEPASPWQCQPRL